MLLPPKAGFADKRPFPPPPSRDTHTRPAPQHLEIRKTEVPQKTERDKTAPPPADTPDASVRPRHQPSGLFIFLLTPAPSRRRLWPNHLPKEGALVSGVSYVSPTTSRPHGSCRQKSSPHRPLSGHARGAYCSPANSRSRGA